jgi:serine/threonine protein kinase
MIQAFEDTTLSHYHLLQLLSHGGMSSVYKAEDTQTGHMVAVKLVHESNTEHYIHFQREVQTMASLTHNHVLPVLEYGEHDSWFYMVMPYIADGTLKQHLTQGPLPTYEAGRLLAQIADALHTLHESGITHGDIKPSNILLHNGTHCYLADFGLSQSIQETSDATLVLQGTPEYMAPELTQHAATPASDIYALGVVLYHMLTGLLPFRSSTAIGLYWRHLHEQPVAPSFYNPLISHATDRVVLRALAKDPAERFQTPLEFVQAYQASLRKRSVPSFKMHIGTPAVAAVLFLCVMPSLLGFSFSYLTSHAQTPIRLHVSERLVHTSTTSPVPPQHIASSTPTPPLLQPLPRILMTQRVVKPVAPTSTSNNGDKDDQPKPKHLSKDIVNALSV